MAEEEVGDKAIEERLRKKAASVKRKENVVVPSNQPAVDITEDIYLAVFHVGTSFEILGDPT